MGGAVAHAASVRHGRQFPYSVSRTIKKDAFLKMALDKAHAVCYYIGAVKAMFQFKMKMTFSVLTPYGGVAHLGERLNGIQEVRGSIPLISTRKC